MIWYKNQDVNNDIVVSTRIRLARNLEKYPFPGMAEKQDIQNIKRDVLDALEKKKEIFPEGIRTVNMSEIDIPSRQLMVERHLISRELAGNQEGVAVIDADEEVSIMVMEEDHIRIQVIKSGFNLESTYSLANKVDDAIEEHCTYAFSEKFGYLTACPTNTGTGMRASVMMHLPALTMTDNIGKIMASASRLGLTVRGLYGEGSKAYGSLYQLSNEVTLGLSEEEILKKLENISMQIIKLEKEAREALKDNISVKDRLWRSLGTLRYARILNSRDAKALLSDYILGVSIGIITEPVKVNPIELMMLTEPENIKRISGEGELDAVGRDEKRAELLRASV